MELTVLISILCFLLGLSSGIAAYEGKKIMCPLTVKGKKIKKELQKEYGKKKGEQILYAMENKGTAKGITKKTGKKKKKK